MTIVEHQAGDHQTHHSRGVMLRNLLPLPPSLGVHSTGPRLRTNSLRAQPGSQMQNTQKRACVSSRISMAPRAAEKAAWAQPWLAVMASSPWSCEPLVLAADR
jgi:hypothetical protein